MSTIPEARPSSPSMRLMQLVIAIIQISVTTSETPEGNLM